MKRLLFLFVILLVPVIAYSQSTEELIDRGHKNLSESKFADAKDDFSSALEKSGSIEKELKASVYLGIGKAEYGLKQYQSAAKSLKKSAKLRKGKHAETLYFQGLTQAALGKEEAATRLFNLALAVNSKHGESWFELGRLLLKQGNSSRAKIAFEMALKNGTNRSDEAKSQLAKISESSKYDSES